MNRPLAKFSTAACLVLLAGALGGCGTGGYDERREKRLEELRRESAFNELYDATELPGVPVSLRVPKVFQQSFVEGSVIEDKEGKKETVDPRRVKPGLLELPDLRITYEAMTDLKIDLKTGPQEGKVAYYCYFGAKEVPKTRPPNYAEDLWQQFQHEKFGKGKTEQKAVGCPTPKGGEVQWQRLRAVTDAQDFYFVGADGKGRFERLPGTLEVYVLQQSGWGVFVAWRVPTAVEEQVGLDRLARLVGGCVVLSATGEGQ